MSQFVAVIMAGGRGQRFWPLSTEDKPKQFLDLERSGRTLIQTTYDRLLPLTGDPKHIYIATAERYVDLVHAQLGDVPKENLIIEPVGRDSAPAIALASLTIASRYADPIMGFFSSDHRIGDVSRFHDSVNSAVALTEQTRGITTIGIKPARPAVGYGYIQMGEEIGEGLINPGYKVEAFVEKPNRAIAESYIASGNYVWNAGIFVWHAGTILSELATHAPELMRPLSTAFRDGTIETVFPTLTKISIDYAVMEKTSKVYVVPGEFDWDDIGDWVALERLLKNDQPEANTVVGKHIGLDASGNIIYSEDEEGVIVTLGVKNLVVVKRGDAVLILQKDRVQDIKKLLEDDRLSDVILEKTGL